MKKILSVLLLCPILSFAGNYVDTYMCKVVGISDGDTITCLTEEKEQVKIRLYQIDAPEKGQDFGNKSKEYLSNLIFNKTVQVINYGKDRYGRTLSTIMLQTSPVKEKYSDCEIIHRIDVNITMIYEGMAWYYPFAKKNDIYKQAEEKARANKVGLWSQKAIAPWEFRKNKKKPQ